MKSKLVFALTAAAAIGLLLLGRGCSGRKAVTAVKVETVDAAAAGDNARPEEFSLSAADDDGYDLPEREEIRRKHKITPGTEVFVTGVKRFGVDTDHTQAFVISFDGKVKVETADTDTAEVLIVRSAVNREDLQSQNVEIINDENLFIRLGDDEEPEHVRTIRKKLMRVGKRLPETSPSPDPAPEIRMRAILRLPRKTGLEIREVGGDVTVGDAGGHLGITQVTGNVRVERSAGPINMGYINGDIGVTFAPLRSGDVRIGGDINGNIDLRFESEMNVDLNTFGLNGAIKPDSPKVEMSLSEPAQGRYKARIGNGSLGIEIHGVNGNLTLSKAAQRDVKVTSR
jgi:hypothetical protein